MKRPQFGLRLMLPVTALAASLFAWRPNAIDLNQRSIQERRMDLEVKLKKLRRAKIEAIKLDLPTYNSKTTIKRIYPIIIGDSERVSALKAQIAQANKKLEAIYAAQ